MEESNGKLVPIAGPADPDSFKLVSSLRAWTSLDLENAKDQALYMRAKSADCLDFDAAKDREIDLEHVLCHEVERTDSKTGEVVRFVRNVLIDADGTMIAGGSQGIRSSLADLIAIRKMPPWKPPIRVKLGSLKTAQKYTMHFLELVV